MPEVYFTVELPDGKTKQCYSPSSVVHSYFKSGEEMAVSDFVDRSRKALNEASRRVRAKFGFACTAASSQLAEIEKFTGHYPDDATVRVLSI